MGKWTSAEQHRGVLCTEDAWIEEEEASQELPRSGVLSEYASGHDYITIEFQDHRSAFTIAHAEYTCLDVLMVACRLGEANLGQSPSVRARHSPLPELSLLFPARPCFPPSLLHAVVTAFLPDESVKCADLYADSFSKVLDFVGALTGGV